MRREPRDDPDDLGESRISDVDEWGRSEHMRELARRSTTRSTATGSGPSGRASRSIPTDGGALLVANHAGAIPSDAPVIMHGIETELDRPVYGLADHLFKAAAGRRHAVVPRRRRGRPPRQRLPAAARAAAARARVPRGHQGPGQDLQRALPAAPLRPRRLRRDRHAGRRAHRPHRGGRRRGVDADPVSSCRALAKALGFPTCRSPPTCWPLGPLGAVGYFPAKFKLRVLDPVHFDVAPDQERYSQSRIMDESEAIRERIQEALYDMLRATPQSVWFG